MNETTAKKSYKVVTGLDPLSPKEFDNIHDALRYMDSFKGVTWANWA